MIDDHLGAVERDHAHPVSDPTGAGGPVSLIRIDGVTLVLVGEPGAYEIWLDGGLGDTAEGVPAGYSGVVIGEGPTVADARQRALTQLLALATALQARV